MLIIIFVLLFSGCGPVFDPDDISKLQDYIKSYDESLKEINKNLVRIADSIKQE